MDIVAHRGFGDTYPENTTEAFQRAAQTADWVELDVRRCQSGELVVFHDDQLDRMTDVSGRVINHSWETLQDIEILDSGAQIPSLKEALAAIPTDTGVEIELKEWGTTEDALRIIVGVDNPVTIISFSPLILHAVTEYAPEMPLGHVLYDGIYEDAPDLGLDTAAHLGCESVHLFAPMGSRESVVKAAHDRNLLVQTATPQEGPTEEVVESYRSVGVDRLSTDRPVDHP